MKKKEITIEDLARMVQVGFSEAKKQVDSRFVQVDKRFEQIDKRFEQVDKRLDNLENKVTKIDGHLY